MKQMSMKMFDAISKPILNIKIKFEMKPDGSYKGYYEDF